MPASVQAVPVADRVRRLLAGGLALLVLALTIFAASPGAHRLLHDGGNARASDDGCAVVLFASGVALPVGPLAIAPPAELMGSVSPVMAADLFLVSPRYLRQPERGPPARA